VNKALVIGIDHYYNGTNALGGCVNDAKAVEARLRLNEDGSPNFDVQLLLSSDRLGVDSNRLQEAVEKFFRTGGAETAILYFAGHGVIGDATGDGYIAASDQKQGMRMSNIVRLANAANPNIRSSVVILDCCHAGLAGDAAGFAADAVSALGTGTTILTSCDRAELAQEGERHGLFTELLLDGLDGGCSDICGNITPASLYAYIDQTLGAHEQRPIYKANVQRFVTLRRVAPKIPLDVLRKLPVHFPQPAYVFPLDPSYEPDRKNVPEEFRNLPVDPDHVRVFKELQMFNRHGLVTPVGADAMYYAAIHTKGCALTALGRHYRRLAEKGRL
jgi:hypothetical protein